MKWRVLILMLFGLALTVAFGQTDSTVRVNQFPGSNVGAKVTAAMASCNPSTAVPCFILIDASLAAANPGVLPTLCGHCYLIDYRSGLPWGGGGATVHGPGHSVQYANTGVTALDSQAQFSYDPTTHILTVGGAIVGNSFTLKNLGSIPSSWTLDVTSPATARDSLTWPDGCLYGSSGAIHGTASPCPSSGGPTNPTCSGGTCYVTYPDGTIEVDGISAAVTGTPIAQTVAISYPVTFTTPPIPVVSPVADAAGGGGSCSSGQCSVSCHVVKGSMTTTGANVGIAVAVNVGGSGFANLATGDYCSYHVKGK